jgi:hypothetical protein
LFVFFNGNPLRDRSTNQPTNQKYISISKMHRWGFKRETTVTTEECIVLRHEYFQREALHLLTLMNSTTAEKNRKRHNINKNNNNNKIISTIKEESSFLQPSLQEIHEADQESRICQDLHVPVVFSNQVVDNTSPAAMPLISNDFTSEAYKRQRFSDTTLPYREDITVNQDAVSEQSPERPPASAMMMSNVGPHLKSSNMEEMIRKESKHLYDASAQSDDSSIDSSIWDDA